MKGQRNYFKITLLISILVAIIFPLAMTGRPIDGDTFFLIMALSFSLTWAIYAIILLGGIFLFVKRNRKELKILTRGDPSFYIRCRNGMLFGKLPLGDIKTGEWATPNGIDRTSQRLLTMGFKWTKEDGSMDRLFDLVGL
jgi:hypothetical protein